MSGSMKHVRGVTLTPEERRMAGYAPGVTPAERSAAGLTKGHACAVILPDGSRSEVAYSRVNARMHRFDYKALSERVWLSERLEGGLPGIGSKAQELAGKAFLLAQQTEQREMRHAFPPPNQRHTRDKNPKMRAKAAAQCAGMYAVCLRYPSGILVPLSAGCERPEEAQERLRAMRSGDSRTLTIGICCRWARRWQEPRWLAAASDEPDAEDGSSPLGEEDAEDGEDDPWEEKDDFDPDEPMDETEDSEEIDR